MYQKWAQETLDRILEKLNKTVPEIGAAFLEVCPEDTYRDGWIAGWTNGFWPGMLWLAYMQTGDDRFAATAKEIEEKMNVVLNDFYDVDHDVGFIWLLSAGAQYRINGNEESKRRCIKAASYLASRFNLKGNFIQAWNSQPGWAIVDCTMNLALLYWASEITGNPRYRHFARAHAQTVLDYFLRPDGSVNHVLSFDPETGEFLESIQGQAATPQSAWSRGTAWALYGLAINYHHTEDPELLAAAKRVASFFVANLPEDQVSYWDFRVERTPDTPRDSSAAACAACGLLELANYVPPCEQAFYLDTAYRILKSLTDNYSNLDNDKQCLLNCATAHFPANTNVNVGLIYGDYFYMEGITRLAGKLKDTFWHKP